MFFLFCFLCTIHKTLNTKCGLLMSRKVYTPWLFITHRLIAKTSKTAAQKHSPAHMTVTPASMGSPLPHQAHIPNTHYSHVHISFLNDVLWDMEQGHIWICGICILLKCDIKPWTTENDISVSYKITPIGCNSNAFCIVFLNCCIFKQMILLS